MGNSPLAKYTKISPNKTSPRNHKIDTVTIHCYVGQASVESMGAWFAEEAAKCSCNYAIGSDGRIAVIVDEKDRSWCTSNASNDHRAITIECASDNKHPYAVTDNVYKSLIKLLADICERNDIKKLLWKDDKTLIGKVHLQNMTVHRWFANKECPGQYLYERHGEIAKAVNELLAKKTSKKEDTKKEDTKKEETEFDKKIDNSTVREIAKVVYNEAGIIKSYNSLLGAAQCIYDMWKSGDFGRTVTEVMENNFSAYGKDAVTEEACNAVTDVFFNGKRRFKDAQILQFRSLTKYSDGKGNMDKVKCASLLKKYEYLGKDVRNNEWGHLYFGKNLVKETPKKETVKTEEPKKETFKPFKVKVDISGLRIRTGAGTGYAHTGEYTGIGVFTITEVKEGKGSKSGWGKLLSGAGWISLDYAKRI